MPLIFYEKADVAIFFALIIFTFTEYIVGVINVNIYTRHREWFHTVGDQIRGMPHPFFFPIAWVIVYVLIVIALFAFYRSVTFPDTTSYLIDSITILFLYNIMSIKFWPYVLFDKRQTFGALLLMLFVVGSGLAMVIIFAINSQWGPFGTFLPYFLWTLYTLYINAAWLYVELYTLPIKREPSM